jgi:hypothetical protein
MIVSLPRRGGGIHPRTSPTRRAMRHTSAETKRRYQLGTANQVRQAMEKSNESTYGEGRRTTFLLQLEADETEVQKPPLTT